MSIKGSDLRNKAKQLAQNAAATGATGVQLLLNDPDDYNEAILNALAVFDADRPNHRIVDVTVAVAGFRFTLFGAGAVLPAAPSLDAWIEGGSRVTDVWFPYLTTSQGSEPLDRNSWRQQRVPGPKEELELLADSAGIGQVLRLTYDRPHVLDETDATKTSILAADQRAIITLAASLILQLAAVKAAQNTGNSGLPNDIVDRRNQSDIYRSRSKELRETYGSLVGITDSENTPAASSFIELDAEMSYRSAPLWHPFSTH